MAAVFILEGIEDDIYSDEANSASIEENYGEPRLINLNDKPDATLYIINALRANRTYKKVHDYIFATGGALPRLLHCPTPEAFDADVAKRREKAQIVADLVDYRLRYAQHRPTNGHINISHVVFLKWWPTHHIKGRRGVTVKGKSKSTKILFERWHEFQPSSIFIYLNERQGYSQIPGFGDLNFELLKPLIDAANDADELRRFFGAYAYIAEAIRAAGGEKPQFFIPATVPRVEIPTAPFTLTELQTLANYRDTRRQMAGW
jgi:hypothetical protein